MASDPEYPDFPHLPQSDAHAIAEYERGLADGRLPPDARGRTAIPPEDEAWIGTWVCAHVPCD